MAIRSPNPSQSRQVLLDLARSKERISVLQEQIASGKRLVRLSDDPAGAALVLDFQHSIDRNKSYVRQIESARSFLRAAEDTLTPVNDQITRLRELGTQALGNSTTAAGRLAASYEVDGILKTFLSTANRQDQGKYIFAGTRTLTQPFSDPATYNGNSSPITLDIAVSATIVTNIPGDQLFFGPGGQGSATDLFQAAHDLWQGMTTDNLAQIQTAMDNLATIQQRINQNLTDLGGRANTLDDLQESLEGFNITLQALQNTYQDLDYPTAITEFTNEQTAQEASLSTLAKISRTNLFDYLG